MVRQFTTALAALATTLAVPLSAQDAPATPDVPTRVTARTLNAVCTQSRDPCMTYVLGVIDAFGAAVVFAGGRPTFCIPPGTTNESLAQTAVDYVRAHPEEEGLNAAIVVVGALSQAYPCGF